MNAINAGKPLPEAVTPLIAWDAFDQIFLSSDWAITIASITPLQLGVDAGEGFESALSGGESSSPSKQAAAWVAQRVLDASRSVTKAQLRRLNLQAPRSPEHPSAAPFLDGLKRRIEFGIREELTRHFDQSIADWERRALDYVARCSDPLKREQFRTYAGLDQLVSEDAGRKAIKFLAHRTHWYLKGQEDDLELIPDWRFEKLTPRRNAEDETTRARSLVARAIEAIFADNSRRRVTGQPIAPVSRAAIMDIIAQRFERDGPWALVHLTLNSDRPYYGLERPIDPVAIELLEQQRPRLFRVWCPERGE